MAGEVFCLKTVGFQVEKVRVLINLFGVFSGKTLAFWVMNLVPKDWKLAILYSRKMLNFAPDKCGIAADAGNTFKNHDKWDYSIFFPAI